jgi:hypothetical protein
MADHIVPPVTHTLMVNNPLAIARAMIFYRRDISITLDLSRTSAPLDRQVIPGDRYQEPLCRAASVSISGARRFESSSVQFSGVVTALHASI